MSNKILPTPGGRPISNAKYSIQPQARACDIAAVPAGRGSTCGAGECELCSEGRCLIALEIDNRRRMLDQCEERRPYNPHGLKEMLAGTSPRTVGQGRARA